MFPLRIIIPILLLGMPIATAVVGWFISQSQAERELIHQSKHNIKNTIHVSQAIIENAYRRGQQEQLHAVLDTLKLDDPFDYIVLLDDKRNVLYPTVVQRESLIALSLYPELIRQVQINGKSRIIWSEINNSLYAFFPMTLVSERSPTRSENFGVLYLKYNLSDVFEQHTKESFTQLVLLLSASSVLALLMWMIFEGLITRKVEALIKHSQSIAEGETGQLLSMSGRDEFSQLGQAIDDMSLKLEAQHQCILESEQRLSQSQEFSGIASWEWDLTTNEVKTTPLANKLLHLSEDKPIQSKDQFIGAIHVDDRKRVEEAIEKCMRLNILLSIEARVKNIFQQEDCWVSIKGNVVRESEQPVKLLGILQDITQQKAYEKKLRETIKELNYQQFAIDQHSIVSITDKDGIILYVNDMFIQHAGYQRDELVGRSHRILNSGLHDRSFFTKLWQTITQGQVWQGQICNRSKDGSYIWLQTSIVPHYNEIGEIDRFVAIRTDITLQKDIEESLRKERSLLQVIKTIQSEYIAQSGSDNFYQTALGELLRLSESEYGFIGELLYTSDGRHYIKSKAISNIPWTQELEDNYGHKVPPNAEFHELNHYVGAAVTSKEVYISNQPPVSISDTGIDHNALITAFMGVPLFYGDEFVGVLGLANRKQGYDRQLLDYIQPIINAYSQLLVADGTEFKRVQAEQQLAYEKGFLHNTLNHLNEAVLTVDANGQYVLANDLFFKTHELTPDSMTSLSMSMSGWADYLGLLENDGTTPLYLSHNPIYRALHGEKVSGLEICIRKNNQEVITVVANAIPLFDESSKVSAAVLSYVDISQQRKAESEGLKLQLQLQQAQKMEALGQLTGGIAHDFNNMLASILGYTDLALKRYVTDEQVKLKDYLEKVKYSGERARDLIAQMLAFSRKDYSENRNLSPVEVIQEDLKMVSSIIPSSIHLRTAFADEVANIYFDPVKLNQIVINLIINARDALQGKGIITIGVKMAHPDNICDACHENFSGRFVEIYVSDNGQGVDASIIDHIFEPFFTTKEVGKGTGMGLAMVHGIVRAAGGHILVESKKGEGTTLRLFIPPCDALEDNAVVDTSQQGIDVVLQGQRIMVVDDEETVGLFMSELLQDAGARVDYFSKSQEALKAFIKSPADYALLITDFTMPEMTGLELVAACRAKVEALPVILYSGYLTDDIVKSANELNVNEIINKPVDVKVLLSKAAELIAN